MRIELANLEGGKAQFAYEYAPGELVLEDERVAISQPPKVRGSLRQDGRRVKLTGRIEAEIEVECDRCLKPVKMPVSSDFKLEYVSAAEYESQHAVELGEGDMNLVVFDGEVIDIDSLVTEELMLAIPDQVLCKEDCRGICPTCGADKNVQECGCETKEIDPRWTALKNLVNSE